MIQMSVTQNQTLIHPRLGLSWIPRRSLKPSRTPNHHRAAKAVEVAAAAKRKRTSRVQAATDLDQA